MKIGVIGTRGFPEIQGGVETHCMELYTRLALIEGNNITVYRRTPYIDSKNKDSKFNNIRFVDIPVPKSKNFETLLHSFFATIHAFYQKYDFVHFHNSGPGFFIPLFKLTGKKVIFTYHSVSYRQKKWNRFARWFLSLSERISLTNADFVIFVSASIRSEMLGKYNLKKCRVILNGVNLPTRSASSEFIRSLGLTEQKYILSVGRFLEEKGFDYLIRAFGKAKLNGFRLVIAGDTDYPTDYTERLRNYARENDIILTGFIKGDKLNQIYSYARLFVMASFEEGLPIALLEAMSYDVDVLASNIPAHLQVGLDADDYFIVGNEDDLTKKIVEKISETKTRHFRDYLITNYNWDKIAAETYDVYKELNN